MMQMTPLGTQGLEVPAIGLGCMGMSEFYGTASERESMKVLDRAIELGCRFWDTADMYGPFTNEELLGRALLGRRNNVTLATKFGVERGSDGQFKGVRGDPEYVRQSCEASLMRLGVDHIDLYYQHRVDPAVPIEETVGAMSELVAEGKVRFIGLSEADSATIERAHATAPISALQTEYSLWSRDVEKDILPTTRKLGIGFVAYSPLGRGFLSGWIRSRADLEPGDWRLDNPRFTDKAIAHNYALAQAVEAIAKDADATPAQVALAWLLAREDNLAVIPGTKRIERLEENIGASDVQLSTEVMRKLDAIEHEGVVGTRYA